MSDPRDRERELEEALDRVVVAVESYWTDGCNDQEASEEATRAARARIVALFREADRENVEIRKVVGLCKDCTMLMEEEKYSRSEASQ